MSRFALVALAAAGIVAGRLEGQGTGLRHLRDPNVRAALEQAGHALEAARPALEQAAQALEAARPALMELEGLQQDPADSLYRGARAALNAGRYQPAADGFQRVWERYPRSQLVGDALYWAAFSLYRLGGTRNLAAGLQLLVRQGDEHADARTRRDGEVLATRIRGELARLGDPEAAESIAALAAAPAAPAPPARPAVAAPVTAAAPAVPPRGARPAIAPAAPGQQGAPRGRERAEPPQGCEDEDYELRLEALNALLQMDAERALPILNQVLTRRDACSVELRRKAVFLVSQHRGADTEETLLAAARSDPDAEVRAQAVFWLSQVPTDQAVAALDSILLESSDREVQEKAIFALSEHKSERAGQILRRYVERQDAPDELKANAIFWLGQGRSPEAFAFLRDLYPRLTSLELKEKVIFSVSEMRIDDARRWLLDVASNRGESVEMRKKALFWAGQRRDVPVADLARLYDSNDDGEIKEQLIFVYSQRREPAAVDKLMSIAETEPDRELRRKAIFWLGQSKDPRAAEFLLKLINR